MIKPTPPKIVISENLQSKDIYLKKGEKLYYIAISNKGFSAPQTLNFYFEEKNSELTFISLIIAKGHQKYPIEINSYHKNSETKASYSIRSVQFDQSEVDFKGKIAINKNGINTNAYLKHHTITLSDHTRTKTLPSLEINTDEVKLGHSATIGKIDEETIYYLQTRGLNKKEAHELLIKGFLETDFSKIPDETIQRSLSQKICSMLKK